MIQQDLAARLRWHADHDRDGLADVLAETVPADVLRDVCALQQAATATASSGAHPSTTPAP